MSLTTATAFHQTPFTRARGLLVLGIICPNGVDEDLFYQLIVSFSPALERIEEGNDRLAVSLLRCIQNMTSGLVRTARGAPYTLWIAVPLIHAGKMSVFSQAARLLHAMLEALHSLPEYSRRSLVEIFAHAREPEPIEEKVKQIDNAVGLSFDKSNFSLSMANTLFRGMRRPETLAATEQLLRLLLRLSTGSSPTPHNGSSGGSGSGDRARRSSAIPNSAIGFFLALLPTCKTVKALGDLVHAAGGRSSSASAVDGDQERPRLAFEALGLTDENMALLVVTFLIGILETAELEKEQEMLFHLLAQASRAWPDVIAITYVGSPILILWKPN